MHNQNRKLRNPVWLMSVKSLFAGLFLLLCPLAALQAQQRELNDAEIEALLNDQSVQGTFDGREWLSWFGADGSTTYSENKGRPSSGRWRVSGDQYCSQWPPGDGWDCYAVTADGDNLTFVPADGGKPWPGVVVRAKSEKLEFRMQDLQLGEHTVKARLPTGFTLELLTHQMQLPRVLHFSGERLFVGSRSGNIYTLDPPYTDPKVLVTLADYPHSIVVHQGVLYVAQTGGIYAADYNDQNDSLTAEQFRQVISLPGGRGHNSRTMKLGPDGRLYVSLGIAGNCSDQYLDDSYPPDERRGGFFVLDTSQQPDRLEPFASGLRNPVGFDWHPETDVLYASNNGPDHQGYSQPPEYFARVTKGSFHGMPWFQFDGENLVRDNCIESDPPQSIDKVAKPVATFPARIAPMDMLFVTKKANATLLENDAIVALHGSWATSNGGGDGEPATRREPKLVRVHFENGKASGVSDFLTGFQLPNGARWARPMGLALGPDGDIYFSSDDGVHGLYRLRSSKL